MPDGIETKNRALKRGVKPRAVKKVLRAKPVKGEVDHGALTDKIIDRFPTILKALAE